MKLLEKSALKLAFIILTALVAIASSPLYAQAAETAEINVGDTGFILVCAALVLLMTPGLALFYGGMVRKKNVLSILMQCFMVMGLVSVQWVLCGYSLAFGPDIGHLVGGLDWLGLNGVGQEPSGTYATTIPHMAFAAFQMMFAIITAALITGAFAERMRFPVFLIFILLWTTLVYDPVAHWVWGSGGWLLGIGALDFAGGTVVHISSGITGLVAAVVVGRRLGYGQKPMLPHNLPLTVLGAGLLWFGWFGFNAGSALAANGLAASAFLVTNTCTAAGAVAWVLAEWLDHGKPTTLGAASGAVAGLVAITPAAGFVSPLASIAIGLLVSPLCYLAVSRLKAKLEYDDSLDVFGIHGVGGTLGAIATGIFASTAVNPAGVDGLIYGNWHLLLVQIVAVAVTWVYAGGATFLILKIIGLFTPLRVNEEQEEAGLDISLHGEQA